MIEAVVLLLCLAGAPEEPARAPAPGGDSSASEEDAQARFERAAQLLDDLFVATESEREGLEDLIALYALNREEARTVGSARYEAAFALGLARAWALAGRLRGREADLEQALRVLDELIRELDTDPNIDHYRRTILSDAIELKSQLTDRSDAIEEPTEPREAVDDSEAEQGDAEPLDVHPTEADGDATSDGRDDPPTDRRKAGVGLTGGGAAFTAAGITMLSLGIAGDRIAENSGKDPDHSDTEFWDETLPRRRLGWIVAGSIVGAGGVAATVVGAVLLRRSSGGNHVSFLPMLSPSSAGAGIRGRF